MALRTRNSYGSITVCDDVIASLAGHLAMECYGVVEMVPFGFSDSLTDVFKRVGKSRGVRIATKDDRIYVDLFVKFKYGLPVSAVSSSLKNTVKYGLERFTGMIVAAVDVHVVGVKL
ncbi:MAG: Asp23/Gls24 family envelope stress response protein [Clostridia bacterium]|nr:Asp23/Gls24 family envelope stress response protein [Clostridia bacterium]MBQ3067284.1 Asp23/Gls24 family envelope stress response protein [Clostridia bacterium]MBR2966353.1 Asp23/Gls24 family envelope stress response protein [Clostridia bacterium]